MDIMIKTYELIDVLDSSKLILDLVKYKDIILNDKDLRKLIEEGNNTNDEYLLLDIKRRLYKNSDYKNYMDKYNELMYIVMKINSRYNKLLRKGSFCI